VAELKTMPRIDIKADLLKPWGAKWLSTFVKKEGITTEQNTFHKADQNKFVTIFDQTFGEALAIFLNNGPIEKPNSKSYSPIRDDCVEVGDVRIIGGVRPQNFDAGYRPDGPRVVFDSKSLNNNLSIGKNWQNMINDLATEATTVHTRYPYSIVAFAIIIPKPALMAKQQNDIINTLERLNTREKITDLPHLAEAISLVIWDPKTGNIDQNVPQKDSSLRIESLNEHIEELYRERYSGLPPHN